MDDRDNLSSWTWRKARTEHRCNACRETIPAGDLYMVYRGLYDGEWQGAKQCARCHAIWIFLAESRPGEPIDVRLNCGETWGGPESEHVFAFWTRSDAQVYARERVAS